jgi:hypothetical protein
MPIFSPKNCRKSPKIVIITSTPDFTIGCFFAKFGAFFRNVSGHTERNKVRTDQKALAGFEVEFRQVMAFLRPLKKRPRPFVVFIQRNLTYVGMYVRIDKF